MTLVNKVSNVNEKLDLELKQRKKKIVQKFHIKLYF